MLQKMMGKDFDTFFHTSHTMDEDDVNTLNAEDRKQQREERALKNKILSISNEQRKQEEWHKHFPPVREQDDSYLEGDIF